MYPQYLLIDRLRVHLCENSFFSSRQNKGVIPPLARPALLGHFIFLPKKLGGPSVNTKLVFLKLNFSSPPFPALYDLSLRTAHVIDEIYLALSFYHLC